MSSTQHSAQMRGNFLAQDEDLTKNRTGNIYSFYFISISVMRGNLECKSLCLWNTLYKKLLLYLCFFFYAVFCLFVFPHLSLFIFWGVKPLLDESSVDITKNIKLELNIFHQTSV